MSPSFLTSSAYLQFYKISSSLSLHNSSVLAIDNVPSPLHLHRITTQLMIGSSFSFSDSVAPVVVLVVVVFIVVPVPHHTSSSSSSATWVLLVHIVRLLHTIHTPSSTLALIVCFLLLLLLTTATQELPPTSSQRPPANVSRASHGTRPRRTTMTTTGIIVSRSAGPACDHSPW